MLALAHRHRHLRDADLVADRHHEALDLWVVAWQIRGEEADRRTVERLEARRGVGQPLMGDPRDDPGEDADAGPAGSRRPVAARGQEARADREVGLARGDRRDDRAELSRVVLAVAVEPHGEVVAPLPREAEAGLDGPADPEVERQPDDVRAGRGRDLGGAVGRAVRDDHDLEAVIELE